MMGLTSPTWLQKIKSHERLLIIVVIVSLIILRVPYIATHHVQEDAYIHFQHMRSLSQTGSFGFNPGEHVNGSTSTFFVFLFTPLFTLFDSNAIPIILLINVIILNLALLKWVYVLMPEQDIIKKLLAFALISMLPVTLITSYTGMETSLLVTAYIALLYDLSQAKRTWSGMIALGLLPWIRIDSIAFAGLYLFALWFINRKQMLMMSVIYSFSLAMMLIGFAIYFEQILPQTIVGKSVTYGVNDTSLSSRISSGFEALSMVLLPIHSRFFAKFNIVWVLILGISNCFLMWRGWRSPYRLIYGVVAGMSIIVPAIYGLSGSAIFKWYIWPSSILLLSVIITIIITMGSDFIKKRSIYIALIGLIVAGIAILAALQFVASFTAGIKEFGYRQSIGIWIHENSDAEDTIFLEPIGYIGYASERYVHDLVGLVSPQVTAYRLKYKDDWYQPYLTDYQPTYLVLRDQELETLRQSDELRRFLDEHYQIQKTFSFDENDYVQNPLLLRLLSNVIEEDYQLLKLIK